MQYTKDGTLGATDVEVKFFVGDKGAQWLYRNTAAWCFAHV